MTDTEARPPEGDRPPEPTGSTTAPTVAEPERPPEGRGVPGRASIELRVSGARDRFERLLRGRRLTRRIRSLMVLLVLLTFAGWIYVIYRQVASFDTQAFEKEMESRAEVIWPRISEMMFKVVTEVRPAYASAITRELEKTAPLIGERIDNEVRILEANVQKGLQDKLDQSLSRVAAEQRNELKKAFPELADDPVMLDRMVTVIQEGITVWVSKELTTTLHEHVDALLQIKETLASFRPDDPKATATSEEVLGVWLELVYETLGGDELLEPTAPATPSSPGAPGRPPKAARKPPTPPKDPPRAAGER